MTTWIESSGGPLVALPESLLTAWMGIGGSSSGGVPDYERACQVDEEVATIPCRDRTALVLGDEPLRTTWIPDQNGGTIVRWVYADSETAALAAVTRQGVEAAVKDIGVRFEVDGPVRLIDAADPGSDLSSGSITFALGAGSYRIESGIIDAGSDVRLVVHRLIRA